MTGRLSLLRRSGTSSRGVPYLIRPALETDAVDIVALHDAVAAEGIHIAGVPGDRSVLEESLNLAGILNGGGLSLVLEIEGRVAGNVIVQRFQTRYHRHLGELAIIVAGPHRRTGLGRTLMNTAIEWAITVRLAKLCLNVFPTNVAAVALYRGLGFEEEGLRRNQVLMPDGYRDVLAMGLLLPGATRDGGRRSP
ncbi:MAG: N-acetyltransferase family protein [Candidatus Dormibacteria bacterium]